MLSYCNEGNLIFLYIFIVLALVLFLFEINKKNIEKIAKYKKYKKIFAKYNLLHNDNVLIFSNFFATKLRKNYAFNVNHKDFIVRKKGSNWQKSFYQILIDFQFFENSVSMN